MFSGYLTLCFSLDIIAEKLFDKHYELENARVARIEATERVESINTFLVEIDREIQKLTLKRNMEQNDSLIWKLFDNSIKGKMKIKEEAENNYRIALEDKENKANQFKNTIYQCTKSRILRAYILNEYL
jgi:hypothetical protein